jgi:hypothetical protein
MGDNVLLLLFGSVSVEADADSRTNLVIATADGNLLGFKIDTFVEPVRRLLTDDSFRNHMSGDQKVATISELIDRGIAQIRRRT